MPRNREIVLYYYPENTKSVTKRKAVMIQMGVRIIHVDPEQFSQKIGYLAQMEGYERREELCGKEIDQEVFVMGGFTRERMEELLRRMSKAKLPKIPLKAVVTETNAAWSFYELYQEILKEHQQMQRESDKPAHSSDFE